CARGRGAVPGERDGPEAGPGDDGRATRRASTPSARTRKRQAPPPSARWLLPRCRGALPGKEGGMAEWLLLGVLYDPLPRSIPVRLLERREGQALLLVFD